MTLVFFFCVTDNVKQTLVQPKLNDQRFLDTDVQRNLVLGSTESRRTTA